MPSYNRIILAGNLTRDPQLKFLPSQMPVAEFGLVVNHKFKGRDGIDREEVLFIDCTIFGKGAEVIQQYCQKGKALLVEGRLKFDTWEDKQGGGKRSKHSVVVDNFQFLGGRDDGGSAQDNRQPRQQQSSAGGYGKFRPKPQPAPEGPPFGDEKVFEDDSIPFRAVMPVRWV